MNGITLQRRHGQVSVHWPRLAAEQLFIGRAPADAIALAPQLFSLCGHAQQLAATLALAAASGQPVQADQQTLAKVRLEAIRETLRRWLLDWAPACGQPCDASAIAVLARARHATGLPPVGRVQHFRYRASHLVPVRPARLAAMGGRWR